eukprot:CCRYP_013446-RA/>CCRYP_013446-RA protein AED:0.35 eAED:0.35 QI:0/0/0/1/0/0/2/0/127
MDVHQQAFGIMWFLMAADALAVYPDQNKWFGIYTDVSDFQLGACIMQNSHPIASFSHKLNNAQNNYTGMQKGTPFHHSDFESPQNTTCSVVGQQDRGIISLLKKMVKPVLVSDIKDDEEEVYLLDHD